jgi:hypothetical protein
MALMTATMPVAAQSVLERGMTTEKIIVPAQSGIVVEQGYYYPGATQSTNAAPFVYGSPIPTPMPVNPSTGLMPSNTTTNYYYSYPANSYPLRSRVEDSTLINPTLINPRIKDSTIINPVIVNDPVYRIPVRHQRSRIIIGY